MESGMIIFILLVLALGCAVILAFSGVRTGGRLIPKPPEHLRPKERGIVIKKGLFYKKKSSSSLPRKYKVY